jgi:predicted transcriptional regulator
MNIKLKNKIVKKYKNMSRFAAISGITYMRLYKIVNYGTKEEVDEILKIIETDELKDRALKGEVSDELINHVKSKLSNVKNIKIWCLENGVSNYWLQQFLEGKTPFVGKKVLRLKKILDI